MEGLVFRAIKSGSCREKSLSGINYNCYLRIEIDKILVRRTDFQNAAGGCSEKSCAIGCGGKIEHKNPLARMREAS
jgi:hypothetical protein